MLYPRPLSAGAKFSRRPDTLVSNPNGDGELKQALLHKIGLVAAHHARNVEALHRLRRAAPTKAWGDDTNFPRRDEATSPVRGSRRLSSMDDSKLNTTGATHRVFTALRRDLRGRRSFSRVTASTGMLRKHEPTFVEPFRSMETHAAAWKRKIRQQEERDFQIRKEEEEARARDRERAMLAAKEGAEFSGVIARSNEMMERRRERILEAEAREVEARKRYEFKARPVHLTDEDWQTIQDRQNIRRKQRVQMRKKQMASISHLPRRMAMHDLQKKKYTTTPGSVDVADRRETKGETEAHSAVSRSVPPDRIREVLARKQRRWDQRLAATKWRKKLVEPQVLPMEERAKAYRKRAQERAQRERERAAVARQRAEEENRRRKEKAFSAHVPVVPRTTHSFLVKTAQVRAMLDKERDERKLEAKLQLKRHARQQETSKALAEVMREMDRQQGRQPRRDRDRDAERKARECHRKYHQALKENKARLEQATAARPTLWEQHDTGVRKEAAKRIALSTIAERILLAGSAGAKGSHWKRGSAADQIFDEEERAALGVCLC